MKKIKSLDKVYAENLEILKSGKCPYCGAGIRHNLALTGWIQCDQFGADGFRKDSLKPSCNFQGFIS